jgi:hypothetical protein
MIYFHTKNPNLGKFWRALEWKLLVYFMTIWNTYICTVTVYFMAVRSRYVIWYIFPFWYVWAKKNLATPAPDFSRLEPNLRELKSSLNSWTPRFVRRNFVLIDIYQKVCCPKVD